MLNLREIIIVEGKYDKKRLQQIVCSPILATDGFDIFKNRAKQELFRKVAKERGIIVLTDSDGAGFNIRSFVKSIIGDGGEVKHAYIPDVFGKERRKDKMGAEGKLGVEGMSEQVLKSALERAGAHTGDARGITKQDLYELGLLGGSDSREKRAKLCRKIGLPVRISTNSLAEVLGVFYSVEELREILEG